jgi:diaminopimelate epimerase
MKFTKMHGAGNDYVYVNAFEETVDNPVETAIEVSHRHFGIGSDGLILIKPTEGAAAEMEMYNSDGSISEMCGNGLRCVAKYVFDHNICNEEEFNLQTGAGIKGVKIHKDSKGKAEKVTIDMSPPILIGTEIPTTWDQDEVINEEISVADKTFKATCVSMGNPHCVIYVDDVKNFPVEKYGPLIENHERFPNRVNVEFVEIVSKDEVIQRTWERGSGETWACGTGACAVCVAGVLTGNTSENILNHLLGGDLELSYSKGSTVIMTGPATEVFTGVI